MSFSASFFVSQNTIKKVILAPSKQLQYQVHIENSDSLIKKQIERWMADYLGKRTTAIELPLDLSTFTPFIQKGLKAIRQIPFGETASYQMISERIGHPKAARAIGNVCNRNPFPLVIPCHRVIASNGSLRGFAYGLSLKEHMLEFEHIPK